MLKETNNIKIIMFLVFSKENSVYIHTHNISFISLFPLETFLDRTPTRIDGLSRGLNLTNFD